MSALPCFPAAPLADTASAPRTRYAADAPRWRSRNARPPRIESERLVLRHYRSDDFEALHAISSMPAVWTYGNRGPMTPEESWARLLRHAGHWALHGYGIFAIEEKVGGRFVGEVGFGHFRRGLGDDFDPFMEASWTISPDCQGLGYATEAAAAALGWIARMRAARTVCLIHVDNVPSLRVAEKLGFAPLRRIHYRGYRALLMQRCGARDADELLWGEHGAAPERASPR
jgi:RimJ/RimL family protein N-acetyltransferase